MMLPVSVCHQYRRPGSGPLPMVFWTQIHASGLIGSPTLPSRRSLRQVVFSPESRLRSFIDARIKVGAV